MSEPMEDTSGDCQETDATKPSCILRPGSMGEWATSCW